MRRVKLDSEAIEAVNYNGRKRNLLVEFRGGGKYRYFRVPRTMYLGLLKAESAGAFWNAVKHQFEYEKLE